MFDIFLSPSNSIKSVLSFTIGKAALIDGIVYMYVYMYVYIYEWNGR